MKAGGWLLVVLAACASGQPNQERLGDEAWHDGRWSDAVADYRGAGNAPRVVAKTADAALQGDLLIDAAQAWTRLGTETPERAGEAAAGLERVAETADREGNQAALASALLDLRQLSPGWPLGRLAVRLTLPPDFPATDAAKILPAALAALSGRSAADPLLEALGHADRVRGACDRGVPLLEGVARRAAGAELKDSATADLAWCELSLGLSALTATKAAEAEVWFDHAARNDPDGAVGRRATIGLGDARMRQGDLTAATDAWQSVVRHEPADSITQLALQRLAPPEPPAAKPDTSVQVGRS